MLIVITKTAKSFTVCKSFTDLKNLVCSVWDSNSKHELNTGKNESKESLWKRRVFLELTPDDENKMKHEGHLKMKTKKSQLSPAYHRFSNSCSSTHTSASNIEWHLVWCLVHKNVPSTILDASKKNDILKRRWRHFLMKFWWLFSHTFFCETPQKHLLTLLIDTNWTSMSIRFHQITKASVTEFFFVKCEKKRTCFFETQKPIRDEETLT